MNVFKCTEDDTGNHNNLGTITNQFAKEEIRLERDLNINS